MRFEEIAGHENLKESIVNSIQGGRISHAQLFHGPEGNGAILMAIAYAQYLSCENKTDTDSCGSCSSCKQFRSFNYPDLHFVYPVAKTQKSNDKPTSIQFIEEWRDLVHQEGYFGLFRWLECLGIENKQAQISVHESADILKHLSLKSYSGGYTFMIIWMPERMNGSAANKLLKAIEEPPEKTVFLLVSENVETIIQTITSRCQKILVPKYNSQTIEQYLTDNEEVDPSQARVIAKLADGNLADALNRSKRADAYKHYAIQFSSWVRACFKADTHQILNWVDEVSKLEREKLKDFLHFCSSTVKDSFNLNYLQDQVSNTTFSEIKFELEKFAPFVHIKNTPDILSLLDAATYDIGRNGNPKVILTDVSLNMARKLRVKL
jgi:DNA polymerase-3 subunit delta'